MNEFTQLGILTAVHQISTELSPKHKLHIEISFPYEDVCISSKNEATDNFIILHLLETVLSDTPSITYIDKNKAHHTQSYPDWQSAYAGFKALLQESMPEETAGGAV